MDKAVHTDAKSSAPMSHLEEGAKSTLDPCNVFVKHLPSEWQDSDLTSSFGTYGSVISSKIMLDPTTRKSLGFGFVRFEHSDAALRAIASMDGHRIGTKKLLCKLANSPKEKEAVPVSAGKTADDGSPRHRPAAHKGATSSGTHHHMLVSSPSMPNTATNAGIPSNYAGNTSTLNMASSSAMPQPVLRSSSTPNLPASYARAAIHLPRTPSTNLYLKGLLSGDTEETLQTLFGGFGEIEACKVVVDRLTGLSRRIGFVRFKSLENATTAMEMMHGLKRNSSTLLVKYADDEKLKELRKRLRHAAQYAAMPPGGPHDPLAVPLGPAAALTRHGSLEGQVDMLRRGMGAPTGPALSAGGVPVAWPYAAWPSPVYSAPIYDGTPTPWLFLYPPDGYTSPRGTFHAYYHAPPPGTPARGPVYFPYDPSVAPYTSIPLDPTAPHEYTRTYARTAPLPSYTPISRDNSPRDEPAPPPSSSATSSASTSTPAPSQDASASSTASSSL